jgi:peptide/nickel transport system ATP-binding protein
MTQPLLTVRNLTKHFPIVKGLLRKTVGQVKAVDNVSFHIDEGETLGLVGESGCGKTTTGMLILRMLERTAGSIVMDHNGAPVDLATLSGRELRSFRRHIQLVFQDPFSSLNPRMTVKDIIAEPLKAQRYGTRKKIEDRVKWLVNAVGLKVEHLPRYPHAFSGGQRQRICIARALALNPKLVVCDEPVSALDVSVQAQIINLLKDLQEEFGLTYLFVAHDLSVVENISNRIAVMYAGRIVELAPTDELFHNPAHPYTEALLRAVPVADPRAGRNTDVLTGEVADPANLPTGCAFHPRCPHATDQCRTQRPELSEHAEHHTVACHRTSELNLEGVT